MKSSVKLQTTTIWVCITNAKSSALFFVTILSCFQFGIHRPFMTVIHVCYRCPRGYIVWLDNVYMYPKTSRLLTKPNRKEEGPFIFEEEHKKENFRLCLLIYNTCGGHNRKLTVRQVGNQTWISKIRDDVTMLYPQMTKEPKKEQKNSPKMDGSSRECLFCLFYDDS